MFMEKKFLKMRDGTELYVQIKETGSPVWLIAVHGIGEHLERHKYIPELFGHDFNIFQFDLRGHGRSTGKRAWVNDFSDYMHDLREAIAFLHEKYHMTRYVLFGHSMGALIASAFLQNYVDKNVYPERFVINAPPVGAHGLLGKVLKNISPSVFQGAANLPFSFPVFGMVDLAYLSHDPRVKEDYINDELCSTKLQSKLLIELMKYSQNTFTRPLRVKCDRFVSIGSSDRIVGVDALVDYFTNVDKSFSLKIIDGSYHEIHNEIEKYRKPYFDYLKTTINGVLYSKE